MRAPIASICAWARSMVTPGFNRPMTCSQWKLRARSVGANASGRHRRLAPRSKALPSGITPMIVNGRSSSEMD